MPVMYVKLRAIFQPNGGHIDFFFSLKWDHYFIVGFLCLIKPDSDRISTLEPLFTPWGSGVGARDGAPW